MGYDVVIACKREKVLHILLAGFSMSTGKHSDVHSHKYDGELYSQVYGELRKIAAAKMAREAPFSTLQATALVHEAWLRLGGDQQPQWQSKAQFYYAAAESMRRILIDRARKKLRLKHGGNHVRVNLENMDALASEEGQSEHLLAVNEALEKFSLIDSRRAELVKLRYYIGLTIEEAAETMGISKTTARRWWIFSKSWLFNEISSL